MCVSFIYISSMWHLFYAETPLLSFWKDWTLSEEVTLLLFASLLSRLTFKAPITTAADDIHKYYFHCFSEKKDLMFQVNPL